jgi:CheY-like chemotaxis protein
MDAVLILRELKRGGFDPSWSCVANEAEYLAALVPALDVILADFTMPQFNVLRALELLKIEAPVAQPASGSLRGSETILVVEDEEGVRELARRVLERCGYRILIAPTPFEALDITRTEPGTIHLLLSDVVLPQMSGSALTARIGPGRPGMRVLYMSGYTNDVIVRRGILDEGTPFLRKPFTSEALARKVREVLSQGERVERVSDVADAVARKE